jgi:NADH-quinone oxidoreductase subunit L|tara:strand:- start:1236 stop:3173 length:1938 start_codon:yes stop_codon:yes gene_type:complete
MELVYIFIPLLPLLAFVVLALGGSHFQSNSHKIGIPAIAGSFILSILAFVQVLNSGPIEVPLYTLLESGNLTIDLGLYVDQLTVLLLLLVSGVSGVVHVYSSRYMIDDPKYNQFFAVIALFTFSMLMLVMSRNLLMLYVFWEVMGICSYLLISHAADRKSAGQAATKAFLVNAVADVGFGLGVILAFRTFGTLDISQILELAPAMTKDTVNVLAWAGLDLHIRSVTLISLLLFTGAMGKSAQIPFHVWLPFAMEAPTPVSALIHAATMVNAGPFLLVRLSPLIVLSPAAMTFIAVIGAATAVFAGIVSLTQSDIKKILAYSTISQIGFMVMACGLGAFAVAIFHLLAHGCYKAFFFLSTGNTLRSVEQGLEHGDHAHPSSHGSAALNIGSLLLACLPPFVLFSGSYEYLWGVTGFASATIGFRIIGLITVFVTSVYLFRGIMLLFNQGPKTYWPTSEQSGSESHSIQPKFVNGSILTVLLVTTLLLGVMLTIFWNWFADFLTPGLALPGISLVERSGEASFQIWLLVSLTVAIAGWAFAYSQAYFKKRVAKADKKKAWLYVLFWNKFYVDEIYDAYIVNPITRLAQRFSRSAERREQRQNMEKFSRQTMALGDMLAVAKPRFIGHNILFMIFGFVFIMSLLYILS